jgi:hypothetical protein
MKNIMLGVALGVLFMLYGSPQAIAQPELQSDLCYAEQGNFCQCMRQHFAEECPGCRVRNLVNTIRNQINTVCHAKAVLYKNIDIDNCIQGLRCFIYGQTVDPQHPCQQKCEY